MRPDRSMIGGGVIKGSSMRSFSIARILAIAVTCSGVAACAGGTASTAYAGGVGAGLNVSTTVNKPAFVVRLTAQHTVVVLNANAGVGNG
jgi:hypothetical protein